MKFKNDGLAGVFAGQSAISTVGSAGKGLNYRGYSIDDLVTYASFEEVAYLLHYARLPTQKELNEYTKKLLGLRELPQALKTLLKLIPKTAHPMDVLRSGCSFLGTIEPEASFSQQQEIADRLLAVFPGMIGYWYAWHFKNKEIAALTDEATTGGHILSLLGHEPTELEREVINSSLILYAEHEFNASTFAARVSASTLADFYSAITSGIGTLRGPLHGGANEAAMELIERFKSPDEVESKLSAMLLNKVKIMGFGHRVYTQSDPRSDIIKNCSLRLGKEKGDLLLYQISERIEEVMWREKKLFPNLDFYSASAYHYCAIPTFLFTTLFVMSRISGWSAHVFEQREHNKLMRPLAEYTGPEGRNFPAIETRG